MFKQLWKKWTIDKPAGFGDLLWEVFVVQLATLLNRLTIRQIIALIPVVIVVLAYAHRIPLPPELMLIGDVLAYIDILSVILLLSMLGRIAAVWVFATQAVRYAVKLAGRALAGAQRFDFRRRRERDVRGRKQVTGRTDVDDDYPVFADVAWA